MAFNISDLVNPALLSLAPYQPGKPIADCQREYGLSQIIKLASNENPLGTSPHVMAHLAQAMDQIARYPDGNAYALKQALSQHLGVETEQLIIGNGSEEVLKMLMQTFLWGEHQIMISQYAFIAYQILAKGLGITVTQVPTQGFETDLGAMLAQLTTKTRMIILANPNNPTGTYVNELALKDFLNKLPFNVIVVCDEAYYEYMTGKDYPQTISWLSTYPNLIVTRTFSKAYGLGGLRLGYGVAAKEITDIVNRVRQPFNSNHLAQVAGCLALADQEFVQASVRMNTLGKQQLYEGFAALELEFIPSGGNFILVKMPMNAKTVFQSLLQKGIIVRPMEPYYLDEYLRITIGTQEENASFLLALKEVLFHHKKQERVA